LDKELPAAVTIHGVLSGFQVSQALFAVAELDVATALFSGPRETKTSQRTSARQTRSGATWVSRISGSTVEIIDLGRTLAEGQADSLRSVARYFRQTPHHSATRWRPC
jgi:hypothetical protein